MRAHRQRGVALLVALLAVALAAILIASLLDRGELAFARTRNALRSEQAQAYAQGLEAYAAEILLKDLADDSTIDTNTDIWAQPMPPQQVPGGFIAASARDLNGCFNLNDLSADADRPGAQVSAGATKLFGNLLGVLGVDTTIAQYVQAWLHDAGAGASTTDAYYLSLPVPYRSAQRRFAHVSELRLVRGVTSEIYARIAPYVCALPPGTLINVNTASVPILRSLGPNVTQAQAEALWQNGTAHMSSDDLTHLAQSASITIDPAIQKMLDTKSTYFLASSNITLDGVPFTFYSLITRDPGISVIERSRGSDDALSAAVLPGAAASGR
jgi:general secretion pathway protein K